MRRRALIVGWDGVRFDRVERLGLPNLESLASKGFLHGTTMPDTSEAETSTAPGWSTNLTGCWPAKHGVTSNRAAPHHLDRYPDLLTRLTSSRPGARTLVAAGAAMLCGRKGPGPIIGRGISTTVFHDRTTDARGIVAVDPLVYDDAARYLSGNTKQDYDLAFVYFGGTDQVAHDGGTLGQAYDEAIRLQDSRLGGLLTTLRGRRAYAEEQWLVVVTTDHGHRDEGGHGGPSAVERQSFVAMGVLDGAPDGAPSARVSIDRPEALRNVDIAPTVLAYLGVDIDPDWELDGTPLPFAQA